MSLYDKIQQSNFTLLEKMALIAALTYVDTEKHSQDMGKIFKGIIDAWKDEINKAD